MTPDACFASLDQAFPSGLDPRTSTKILSGYASSVSDICEAEQERGTAKRQNATTLRNVGIIRALAVKETSKNFNLPVRRGHGQACDLLKAEALGMGLRHGPEPWPY